MKRFLGFLKKEFYHIFRDKRSLLILFGMPIAQVLLFGFAITNEIKDAHISILDYSKDAKTKEITDKILSSGYFLLQSDLKNENDIEKAFRQGKVKEVIVFDRNFSENLKREGRARVQIIADATDPNTANTLVNYTRGILLGYQQSLNTAYSMPMQIRPEVKMLYNPSLKGVFMFVPGLITIILMLVSAMMTSISIAREKELGTMEVLIVSPLQPLQIILGKVLPYVLLSFINTIVILSLGKFVFGVPVQGSLALLLAESILFIITTLSLGIMISSLVATQQAAMLISMMGLMLPTILLSGFIFPISSMPLPLRILSNIVPARWFLVIIKDIMLKGAGLRYIWHETLVLVGMTGFFILVSTRKFKMRLS